MRYQLLFTLALIGGNLFAWTLTSQGIRGWQTRTLVIQYSSSGCSITEKELTTAIDAALAAWNQVPNAQVTLARSASSVSTTVAQFLGGLAGNAPVLLCDANFSSNQNVSADSIPALTRLGVSNPINYGGIILNSESGGLANVSTLSAGVLALTIAHEIGHLLGLGHSKKTDALMYYSIANKTGLFISQDDRDGISYLYARNEFTGGLFGCGFVKYENQSRYSPYVFTVWLLLLVLVARAFRFGRPRAKSERRLLSRE